MSDVKTWWFFTLHPTSLLKAKGIPESGDGICVAEAEKLEARRMKFPIVLILLSVVTIAKAAANNSDSFIAVNSRF